MSNQLQLKELERKAWRSVFDDGLWDIYLGLLLGLMGISNLLDETRLGENGGMLVYLALLLLVMAGFFAGKRWITVPRMGRVKFGPRRQKRRKIVALILFASVIVGIGAWVLSDSAGGASAGFIRFFPAIYALNMLLVFGLMGYFLDFERLYFIGLMYALPVPAERLLQAYQLDGGYLVFAIPAALVTVVGVFYLARFLRRYPSVQLPAGDNEHA